MRMIAGTSLVPRADDGVQRRAIQSWLAAGMEVVSFNIPAEIARLEGAHPRVRFVPLAGSGQDLCGKPVPCLAEMLGWLGAQPADVVGIVNDDIVFSGLSGPALARAAAAALVVGVREDVTALDQLQPGAPGDGYDFFFFPPAFADLAGAERFYLGMPCWDWWLPAAAALAGRPLRKTVPAVARHVVHQQAWSDKILHFNGMFVRTVLDTLAGARPPGLAPFADPAWLALDLLGHVEQSMLQRALTDRDAADPREAYHVVMQRFEFLHYVVLAMRQVVEARAEAVDVR